MEGFLGESVVNIKDTPFCDYSRFDWAMYFIESYGQIDGDHHKLWVMDQVARIYNGTEVEIKLAKWENGTEEYRVNLLEASAKYEKWVELMITDEDGETYGYDQGSAP
jgi:hypothetical protein